MKCMCAGPYPSTEQQARTLRDEPEMPRWSFAQYCARVEATNSMLIAMMIRYWNTDMKWRKR